MISHVPREPQTPSPTPPPAPTPPRDDAIADALARSESRYAALVERIGYGVYRSSPEGRFIEVNATLVTMLGYTNPEELYTLDLSRDLYLDPGERERLLQRPTGTAYQAWINSRWKRR